ncbi:hypothetical protein ABL78_6788 [Leptomonas seymouri]|uniref:GPR1/FUN34/yaaH family n=1 Tax=Leptomonas seymouri TaxID=5684 RepID=A0A0N1I0C8_LEPSE|nr:hypothetical protein ABL78_6788 [Leptomonas seymouri]|eukprot:KPI84163.1 hypothetical protein ABL78_6788 [Leptomonas seymouri]
MANISDAFAVGKVTGANREPVHAADEGNVRQRPRRRPCKVVVYYFDEDAEEEVEAGATQPLQPCSKREGSGKRQGLAGASDITTSEGDKMDCPGIEELESYRNENNCRVATGATCCCRCQPRKPVSVDNPRIGSPTPLGFFAFGMTTLLYNVHNARICELNMATMGLIVMFGGMTQFTCGFFELINMNTLGCTISTTYGAFWLATAVLFLQPENQYVTMGDHNYSGGFFLLWFVFSGTLLAAAFRSPFMCIALFFLVPVNFLLQAIGYFADSVTVAKVAGYEGILVGALATYLGMAFTLRDVYGRSVLPILFQKNMRYVEW